MTGSTQAKPLQRRQPKTDVGETRKGQCRPTAPNGYSAEQAQPPSGVKPAVGTKSRFSAGPQVPCAAAQ